MRSQCSVVIIPEIRGMFAYVVNDLETCKPEGESFDLLVELTIGPKGGYGEEVFHLRVISAAYVAEQVRDWSLGDLNRVLTEYCRSATGDTWDEVALKLCRIMDWEFEDYKTPDVAKGPRTYAGPLLPRTLKWLQRYDER
jgi:immunity protein 8 of polymorphic toxin system